MSVRGAVPSAELVVPAGWEASVTIELVEPPRAELAVPLAFGAEVSGEARANLTIRRSPTGDRDPASAYAELLTDLEQYIKGVRREEEGPMTFDDGVVGISIRLLYPTPGGTRVAQLHAFREDSGVLTHFTASVEASQVSRLTKEMAPLIRSFRPK